METNRVPSSRLLIENKYAASASVIGFLLALYFSHGSLMAGLGAFALIAGIAWATRQITQRPERHHADE
jgi:hypothetical protein